MHRFKPQRLAGLAIVWCLGVLSALGAESPTPSTPHGAHAVAPTEGTRKLVDLLQKAIQAGDPMNNRFLNDQRAAILKKQLDDAKDPAQLDALRPAYARELLNAGESLAALKEFQIYEDSYTKAGRPMDKEDRALLLRLKAVCYLRLGEQLNCLSNHNADSCVFPIRGKGVHINPSGSRGAIEVLKQTLVEFPQDLGARWLLNVAYMTLGEYPAAVPAPWRIDPALFESKVDIKRFKDVAPGLGLGVNRLSGGVITDDFDGDGYLDIVSSSLGFNDPLLLFHNNADGTFTDITASTGLAGETGGLNILQTDYDNDGRLDILVLRGAWMGEGGKHPASLLRNRGDGTFDDVTITAGLLRYHPTQAAVWFDFNKDGWIDLFIGNESAKGNHPSELFRNNGDGTFTECAAAYGLDVNAFVKGVSAGDFNNDGWPDLYLSILGKPNMLWRNDGPTKPELGAKSPWKFTDVALAAGVRQPMSSFPCWFFDFDNDGWQDIFVAGYKISDVADVAADYLGLPHKAERARLYRNQGDGTFKDVTREMGLYKVLHAMGSNFGDLDNDGFLDFYVGTGDPDLATLIPNRMFKNLSGTNFAEVTYSGGFGNLQKGHAVAFADLDNDGDQDVFIDMGGAFTGDVYPDVLFENPGHGNHWVTVRLEGVKANRAAIGARISITVTTPTGDRVIRKTVNSGGSFGSSPLRQEIGLGNATAIKSVTVQWPSATPEQTIQGFALDRFYTLREGDTAPRETPLKRFAFKPAGAEAHHHH